MILLINYCLNFTTLLCYNKLIMLTKRQLQLYNFLKSYSKEHHIMPSFEEMKAFMNVKSKSVIHTMLGYIEWKGFIKKYENKARAIEIIKEYNL